MKFIVGTKRIPLTESKKPCPDALEKELTSLDYRDVKTLEEAKTKIWYKSWIEGGERHREENGMVVCDRKMKVKQWVVEIDTLEDLLSFQNKYGDILISDSSPFVETRKEIIIQDRKNS